ncbi:uncharacterized protein LOC116308040 [Actinia tenebrosa]|uniref:Uncharacterized protein LOC116308040 n=1 Tax=Actinia tenebrosa TaxID=6105 RepID=A0A6P8J3N0_ACTTE|nr:uncharacterized protein LOC116308040 [Actinia tenebrosa]
MSTEDAWFIAERLREILQSRHFNKDDFEGRPLKLSQAFCLLWQNKENGEVSGRQRSGRIANAAVLAVLLDLFALGKIEFEAQVKQWIALGRRREITYVKVIDPSPTGTFLDKALFSGILYNYSNTPDKPKTLEEWILQGSYLNPTCATQVLDSLVEAKIFGKTSVLFWKKYPTINPEPEAKLVKELRSIALQGQVADGYMWTLIKLLSDADTSLFGKRDLLSQHFSNEEFPRAKSCFTSLTFIESESRIDARQLQVAQELQVVNDQSKKGGVEEVAAVGPSCSPQEVNVVIKKEEQKKSF